MNDNDPTTTRSRELPPLSRFLAESTWAARRGDRDIMDFMLASPQEMPLPGVTAALKYWSDPLTKDWFGYKGSEEPARELSARTLHERTGVPFKPDDIAMTNGAFGALALAFRLIGQPGAEVIVNTPAWSFYEPLLLAAGLTPVKAPVDATTLDIDVAGVLAAVGAATRAVIINSPNNPTGRIYTTATLRRLANAIGEAARCNGRPIYIVSDEVFARLTFDGARPSSPAEVYANTLVVYSWGKQLMAPGQRIGYLALHPEMPDLEALRDALFAAQLAGGFNVPSALMQHALPDLDPLTIDLEHLQRKRDRLVSTLGSIGYDVRSPEGAVYLLPRAPIADDMTFAGLLADRDLFVLPGSLFDYPGHFRLSLTASDDMIERSLPHFEAALRETGADQAAIAS